MLVPFENTYWVISGFLAGCYPGSPSPDLIPMRLSALLDANISVIISLMERNETYSDGRPYVHYAENFINLAQSRRLKARCYTFPIADFGLPDKQQMRIILNMIDQTLIAQERVFIHCWGGKGRTGTVVGCWLARKGNNNSLSALAELRKNCPNAGQPSPETKEQCAMVQSWQKGD